MPLENLVSQNAEQELYKKIKPKINVALYNSCNPITFKLNLFILI